MTLLVFALLGCARRDDEGGLGDSSPPGPTVPEGAVRVDEVDPFLGPALSAFGYRLAVGSDLDHDGTLEWAATAPRDWELSTQCLMTVFEGDEVLTERPLPEGAFANIYGNAITTGDVDGDGFDDVLFELGKGSYYKLRLLTTTMDADDVFIALGAEGTQYGPTYIDVAPPVEGGPSQLLITWVNGGGSVVTWSTLPLGASSYDEPLPFELEGKVVAEAHTNQEGYTDMGVGLSPGVLLEAGTSPRWFGSFRVFPFDGSERTEQPFLCPVTVGLSFPDDCDWMADSVGFNALNRAFDFDGDGVPELVSSPRLPQPADGQLLVFERDGTVRATLRGTKEVGFGYHHHALVDDEGESWLLVSQANAWGEELGTVYAFRGSNLYGELTDADADRLYVHPTSSRIGFQIESYRPTAADPLMLLLSNPGEGEGGAVYMLPFEP